MTLRRHPHDPRVVRFVLVPATVTVAMLFVLAPVGVVFAEALRKGAGLYVAALTHTDARAALALSLRTAAIAVTANVAFGIAAAWALGKHRVRGRRLLVALIELPLAVSPVVAGLSLVLLFGVRGWFGPWLASHDVRVIFTSTGITLATLFVTLPLVARPLIALMQEHGIADEEAALTLGAGGWHTLTRVTLPNVKWALLYATMLCSARAMGEFGAVSVVSGHVRGVTTTLPLHVEMLYNEYDFVGAFATASLLTGVAIVTLVAQATIEYRARKAEAARA